MPRATVRLAVARKRIPLVRRRQTELKMNMTKTQREAAKNLDEARECYLEEIFGVCCKMGADPRHRRKKMERCDL